MSECVLVKIVVTVYRLYVVPARSCHRRLIACEAALFENETTITKEFLFLFNEFNFFDKEERSIIEFNDDGRKDGVFLKLE